MNRNRKRTSRRLLLIAKYKLAKLNASSIEITPPFFNKIQIYSDVFYNKNYKYILIEGGRGSGKSFFATCVMIEESFDIKHKNKLFVFAREIQTSIKDSVYKLCKSLIEQAFLTKYFIVKSNSIINKITGVEFAFIGLRATGGKTAFSQVNKIKGKFGIAYFIVDEAQDLSEDTINVLFPTVNRGSKVSIIKKPHHEKIKNIVEDETRMIFLMNPNFENDPIKIKVNALIGLNNERGIILHVNIFDIPGKFQDRQLLEQAKLEEKEDYYDHVWLGKPSNKISGYPWISLKQINTSQNVECHCAFLDPSFKGGDYTAISFIGTVSGKLSCWGYMLKGSWNKEIDAIVELLNEYDPDFFYYEDNGLGSVPEDIFAEKGINAIAHVTLGNKENKIYKVASYVAHRTQIITNRCNSAYIDNVIKYNTESKYDDGADSLASAFIKCGIISDKMKF